MADLTKKQKQAYIKSGGNKCPHCKSTNIEVQAGFEADGDWATREVMCLDCKHDWTDYYELKDVIGTND